MDAEQSDLKQYADRLEFACRSQMKRIAELEAEIERLQSVAGAHGVLKAIYGNPDQPTGHRIKAAGLALPHEVPKLMPERAPLELQADPEKVSLFDLAEARRKKTEPFQGRDIEVQPNGEVILLPKRNGNGQDD
jgi:hypothetical protein